MEKKKNPTFFKSDNGEPVSEYALHRNCVQYCQLKQLLINHCHNEFFFLMDDKRKFGQINRAKSMGYSKGYPDLNVFLKNGITLFFEFKKGKNGLSKEQIEWRDRLLSMGHKWYIIRDFETFVKIIEEHNNAK